MSPAAERPLYPFSALVGQEQLRLALLLHAVNPALGGVLVRGRKGTAKSTAVRSLAGLLPELDCVADCPYDCDPLDAASACDGCRQRIAAGEELLMVRRRVPLVELPIGATEDRVIGSLHLETAVQTGERRFEPGLLARANRGILYLDEVNLFGDHLVDLLLDAAAMGRNYVEREGISVGHPARIMLVGTMNPEEGELRPQLLDRFALAVTVDGLQDPADRALAVRNRIAFEADPASFVQSHAGAEAGERKRLARAQTVLPSVTMPAELLDLITHLCVAFEVDGLRADLAMYRAAVACAAYAEREVVTEADIRDVAPLVLAHRRRRQPFEQPGLDQQKLDDAIDQFNAEREQESGDPNEATPEPGTSSEAQSPDASAAADPVTNAAPAAAGRRAPRIGGAEPNAATAKERYSKLEGAPRGAPGLDRWTAPAANTPRIELPPSTRKARREAAGRRLTAQEGQRGATVRTTAARGPVRELAVVATLAAAAPHQLARRAQALSAAAIILKPEDLRVRVRRGKAGNLILFVVDASASMGARERMAATKAAVLGLLLDAYRRRDQVGVISFRGSGAELVLPPTNSVELAERRLTSLVTGGRTPLAAGLELGRITIDRALRGARPLEPALVLVTDGRANSAPNGGNPMQLARYEAKQIRARGWRTVLLDTEQGRSSIGLARTVSTWLSAAYIRLDRGVAIGTALGID